MKRNAKRSSSQKPSADVLTSRRDLLKTGALMVAGSQLTWVRDAFAADKQDTVVVVFLRGGGDGLSMLQPASGADRTQYVNARGSLAIPISTGPTADRSLALSGNAAFRLHPRLAGLKTLFDADKLSFVMGAGSPNNTRSHFEQQDIIEMGNPLKVAGSRYQNGYLNRVLGELAADKKSMAFPGMSMNAALALALRGKQPTVALNKDLTTFGSLGTASIASVMPLKDRVTHTWTSHGAFDYRRIDLLSHQSGNQTVRALAGVDAAKLVTMTPALQADYGSYEGLKTAVQLMKSDPGVRAITLDIGGWDTHKDMGVLSGAFNNLMIDLNKGLKAFQTDLEAQGLWNRVTVIVMSEFGRRLEQNGTGGLDHGRGGLMMAMGGQVRGGQVVTGTNWNLTTLEDGSPGTTEGDMRVTVDYRRVLAEFLTKRMGLNTATIRDDIFPGFNPALANLNIFKA